MIKTPKIEDGEDYISIIGNAESLIALGEMMILKGKMEHHMSATFSDGVNKNIIVELEK